MAEIAIVDVADTIVEQLEPHLLERGHRIVDLSDARGEPGHATVRILAASDRRPLRESVLEAPMPTIVIGSSDCSMSVDNAIEHGVHAYLPGSPVAEEVLLAVESAIKCLRCQSDATQREQELQKQLSIRTHHIWESVRELERAEKRIRDAFAETVKRLGKAVEVRDTHTSEHIHRMSRYVYRLARKAGLSADRCEELRLASPLHDVGKLGIPDSILQKPRQLSMQEFEVLKMHTTIGHDILSGSEVPLLNLAALLALNHHERWDGSGYPNGLVAHEIPLEARIVSIADVFDALTSDRPYRKAMKLDRAVRVMEEMRVTHFDPDLLDLFWGVVSDTHGSSDVHAFEPRAIR